MDLDMDIVDSLFDPTDDPTDTVPEEDVPKKKKKRKTTVKKLGPNEEYFNEAEMEQERIEAEGNPLIDWDLPEDFFTPSVPDHEKKEYVALWLDSETGATQDARMEAHIPHLRWARRLSRNPESGVCISFSNQLLADDLSEEVGSIVAAKVDTNRLSPPQPGMTNSALFESALSSEPLLSSLPSAAPRIYRWLRVTSSPLFSIDEGRVVSIDDLDEPTAPDYLGTTYAGREDLMPPNPTDLPTMILCLDKTSGVEGVRAATRESHLSYLKNSGRVIACGPLFSQTPAPDEKPIGSLVLLNHKSVEAAREFADRDPYALAGLFETVEIKRYNLADVSGKHQAQNKYDPGWVDPAGVGVEEWEEDETPWLA